MPIRRTTRLAAIPLTLLALLALVLACAKTPTRPAGGDIQLSLDVQPSSGGPSTPVAIELRAVNVGLSQVWHCEGCGCGNGTSLEVLDPNGTLVALKPWSPPPGCVDGLVPLPPGGSLANSARFSGVLYKATPDTLPSAPYAAPPGMYTVVAAVSFSSAKRTDPPIRLTRTTTFRWNP